VTRQVGRFNVSNVLGVLGALIAYGVPYPQALALVAELPDVPGRMQVVGERPLVVVDYAHTPDALEKVLSALRPVAEARGGRLAPAVGPGGGRAPRPPRPGFRGGGRPRRRQAARHGAGGLAPRRSRPAHFGQSAQREPASDCRCN